MQTTVTPSGDSHSISSAATLAPRRRGRPRAHKDEAARARAYRRRKKLNGIGTTQKKADAEWNSLSDAEKIFWQEVSVLTKLLHTARSQEDWEEVVSLQEQIEYAEQIERQRTRKVGLTDDYGKFMADAPHGKGLLISGGYGQEEIEREDAERQLVEMIGGERVAPKGRDSDTERKWEGGENDSTFVDRQKFPLKWKESEEQKALRGTTVAVKKPMCCQCGGPASTIHPEDKGKRLSEARFLCGGHLSPRLLERAG